MSSNYNRVKLVPVQVNGVYTLTSSMVSSSNTIYVINCDMYINESSISFGDNCILEFQGGVLHSGLSTPCTISSKITIIAGICQIFDNIVVPDMNNNEVYIEWFGGICTPSMDNELFVNIGESDKALSNAIISYRGRKILFQSGCYKFTEEFNIDRSGIILSGTSSYNRVWKNVRTAENLSNGTNSISTLVFNRSTPNLTFITTTCDGTRFENLLFYDANYNATAIEMKGDCINIYVDRCIFNRWKRGIYKGEETLYETGFSRNIISECSFILIKETGIEATFDKSIPSAQQQDFYITANIIRDTYFHKCYNPIRFISNRVIEDNSIDNCIIDNIGNDEYDTDLYDRLGCSAIYMESTTAQQNFSTNNISRCYFEDIYLYKEYELEPTPSETEKFLIYNDKFYLMPRNCIETFAAIISKNCVLTIDNNFFATVSKYIVIDNNTSISICDNSFGLNNPAFLSLLEYKDHNDGDEDFETNHNRLPFNFKTLIVVVQNDIQGKSNDDYVHIINYGNSLPISCSPNNSFINKLVDFNGSTIKWFRVINKYETKFIDYGPQVFNAINSRNLISISTVRNKNVLQVDYNTSTDGRFTNYYNYHSFRLYIYLQYSVYCDVYEVTVDMGDLSGYAYLVHNKFRSIYGEIGLVPTDNFTIKTKRVSDSRFYILVNANNMNPTFKVLLNSEDIRVRDVSSMVDYDDITEANSIVIRKSKGSSSELPTNLNTYARGYEYYDTTKNLKYIWNGSRWLSIHTGPYNLSNSGTSSQRVSQGNPSSNDIGFMYFDTTLNRPVYWDGARWVDANGNSVS